jgi:hypothetical protein
MHQWQIHTPTWALGLNRDMLHVRGSVTGMSVIETYGQLGGTVKA